MKYTMFFATITLCSAIFGTMAFAGENGSSQQVGSDFVAPDTKPSPCQFASGTIIGNVRMEKSEDGQISYVIHGAVGFVLPEGNNGGILKLSFANPMEQPIDAEFNQFPYALEPQSIALDGKPLEIDIAPSQVYLFVNIENQKKIVIDDIEFKQDTPLSTPATCGCTQIKLSQDATLTPTAIKAMLGIK